MKRVLVTGSNSYVGTSVSNWLAAQPNNYKVEAISLRDGSWNMNEFSKYDVVFHVAGIAHVSTDPRLEQQYYKVNRDLAVKVAQKAKAEGVKQFIFMSSIIVYGEMDGNQNLINVDTRPNPNNFYGNSKLMAEEALKLLVDQNFKIAIVRAPMIYGKGSKGNYQKLSKLARIMPIFPNIDNQRSMLHIDNLCEFIKALIDYEDNGVFFPQNKEYVATSRMCKLIANIHGKQIKLVNWANPLLKYGSKRVALLGKLFGNLAYEQNMSNYRIEYRIRNLEESIRLTEL